MAHTLAHLASHMLIECRPLAPFPFFRLNRRGPTDGIPPPRVGTPGTPAVDVLGPCPTRRNTTPTQIAAASPAQERRAADGVWCAVNSELEVRKAGKADFPMLCLAGTLRGR